MYYSIGDLLETIFKIILIYIESWKVNAVFDIILAMFGIWGN